MNANHKIQKLFRAGYKKDDARRLTKFICKDLYFNQVWNKLWIYELQKRVRQNKQFMLAKEPYSHNEMDYGTYKTYRWDELSNSEKNLIYLKEHYELKKPCKITK